ncbi:hypothetical protein BDR26DRAFT_1004639 [Obelidium mucronatum]|nr:hypothetical protein BDR26DRAFT_1004639 [Obelidium mucronatum]
MGLCKCRNVTNLFCFEHRKNVCEKCIVSDHYKCVVKSYLQWLQDSDYDASCQICSQSLEQGELLRLSCLDIFHLKCVNDMCSKLPETTAPAGYACPVCNAAIIPPDNVNTQIAELVRSAFSSANWAQNILPSKRTVVPFPETSLQRNAHVTTTPAVISNVEQARSTTVSIDSGILPPKKVTTKASSGSIRDGDDDKYKLGSERSSTSWAPRGRFLSPKRLAVGLGILTAMIIFLYYFII